MSPFDDPSSCAIPGDVLFVPLLLPARLDVGGVPHGVNELADVEVVVSPVQAEMRGLFWGGRGSFDDDGVDGVAQHLLVVSVCAVYGQGERDSLAIGEEASLGAGFGSVGGVGSGFFPRLKALSSCTRRRPARSSQWSVSDRICATPSATIS